VKTLRCLAVLVFLALLLSDARATSFDTNNSDLWWVPTESGWGIQFVQQADVIFATMFVYDPSRVPIWYTATLNYASGYTYSGTLYLTNGPWFGGAFNPASVTLRAVGTMTFNVPYVASGALTYSVDGVPVTKTIVRQTLRLENFSGNYAGALESLASGCANPINNGQHENFELIRVNHTGTSFSATSTDAITGGSCVYSGTYAQAGHMGSVSGSYVCTSGETGNITFFEMEVSRGGFTARFTANNNACSSITGRVGGAVRTPNF